MTISEHAYTYAADAGATHEVAAGYAVYLAEMDSAGAVTTDTSHSREFARYLAAEGIDRTGEPVEGDG